MGKFKEANENKDPKMGLNNTICENPAYWCKIHEVWLTEEDVVKKKCNCKPTYDMIGVRKCTSLVPAKSVAMYERVYGKKDNNNMEYRKTELTRFAKECAWGANQMINGICMAEEIAKSDVGRVLSNEFDPRHNELLLEISKRFSKYAKDQQSFDTDIGEVQDFQHIISLIVACCDENGWFGN